MWDSTGQTLGSYLNWAIGEPDIGAVLNETQQNCVVLNSTDQFKWYDHGCKTAELRYICEKKGINNNNFYKILAFGDKNTFFQLPTMMSSQSLHMETVLTRFLAFM